MYIKDMKMPDMCGHCRFTTAFDCEVTCNPIVDHKVRNADCPLIEIPEPHGDLIDRKSLMEGEGRYFISLCKEGIDVEEILRAKTIIPESEVSE